jgi:hypothetical protein
LRGLGLCIKSRLIAKDEMKLVNRLEPTTNKKVYILLTNYLVLGHPFSQKG